MFNLKSEKINWKNYFKEKKYYLSFFGKKPQTDWKIIIGLFIFGLLSIIFIVSISYLNVEHSNFVNIENDSVKLKKINIEEVNKVIEEFNTK